MHGLDLILTARRLLFALLMGAASTTRERIYAPWSKPYAQTKWTLVQLFDIQNSADNPEPPSTRKLNFFRSVENPTGPISFRECFETLEP